MNRFAELVDRLAAANDPAMKQRLRADYSSGVSEAENIIALGILDRTLKFRRLKLSLIRGLAESRLDPVLFALSLKYVGDAAETIALLWPARHGANRAPTLSEIMDGLSTLGRSELPKRLEAWLDACDPKGRWALIKLLTGLIPSDVALITNNSEPQPGALLPAPENSQPGSVDALLMYVEHGRSRSADLICTFGVWNNETLTPLGKASAGLWREQISTFADAHPGKRFGPVTEVTCTPDIALLLEVEYESLHPSPRRKSGLSLNRPKLLRLLPDKPASSATTLPDLLLRLPAHQRRAK